MLAFSLVRHLAALSLVAASIMPLQGGVALAQQAAAAEAGRVVVSAEGRASAVPDMATITLGVVAEAESAQEAVAQMSRAAQAVLDRLSEEGIAPRDLQTSRLSLSPRWRREDGQRETPPAIAGYTAETTVTARIRELDSLGAVLDAAVGGGSNQFRGLSFGLSDPQPVLDAARRAAVAEATRRADLYAEAAGLTLGEVLRLEEADAPGPRPMMRAEMAMADSSPVPVAEGELDVSAQIRMVWAIEGQ